MVTLQNVPLALVAPEQSFRHIMGLVARVLLDYAGESAARRRQLTQRDIAAITGTDWGTVHMTLESLQDEEAIRIDRNRIIINMALLQKAAGSD